MIYEYTDEEILRAWNSRGYLPGQRSHPVKDLRSFLTALPDRPAAAEIASCHTLLDSDESKIIRNAKEGYPEGRESRELTLEERIKALCVYAADWKRWAEKAQAALAALKEEVEQTHREYDEMKRLRAVAVTQLEKAQPELAAVVEARLIRRMEAVPVEELETIYFDIPCTQTRADDMEAVRARLIQAAKGLGEAQPQAVAVNEQAKLEIDVTDVQFVKNPKAPAMKSPSNIMLDLETLGTEPGCIILSIGAVLFGTSSLHDEFYLRINLRSSQEAGLIIDADTLQWWTKQPPEVFEEATSGSTTLAEALYKFAARINQLRMPPKWTIWSNGASFDAPVLEAAFKKLNLPTPWTHLQERCMRTLRALDPDEPRIEPAIKHHALEDAKAQALHAMKIAPWL